MAAPVMLPTTLGRKPEARASECPIPTGFFAATEPVVSTFEPAS